MFAASSLRILGRAMALPELKQPRPRRVEYPESDGTPMAETDFHRDWMVDLIAAVRHRFRRDPRLYVTGNLFLYYEKGDPEKNVAPDFFVVRGVPRRRRRTYKVWEEKKGPDLVVEVSSKKTSLEDSGNKRAIYELLGVKEYFIFDPEGRRSPSPLRGYRLRGFTLEPVPPARKAKDTLVFTSDVLSLELHGSRTSLRWVDPSTGEPLPVPDDYPELLERERQQAERDRQQAERDRQQAERDRQQAEHERQQAEPERQQAARERQRAEAAEAELARLREELERLRRERGD
ncbi:MAG: Uma2 family endonuclease [Planctomycetes bacterium]|nr:Uma2 family endonuclease [Planctomycetota bacterium]